MRLPKNKLFEGKDVVLDLTGVPLKQKKDIQSILETQGANIILVLTRKTNFLITTAQQWQRQSFKVMNAQKLNVPVVDVSYISACLKKRKLLPTYLYAPIPAPTPSILQTSTETSENSTTPFLKRTREKKFELKPEPYESESAESSPYQIALNHFLIKPTKPHSLFACLELHVHNNVFKPSSVDTENVSMVEEGAEKNYRVFVHHGSTKDLYPNAKQQGATQSNTVCGVREVYHIDSIEDAESFYAQLHERYSKKNGYKDYHIISDKIGSDLLPLSAFFSRFSTNSILPPAVQKLVSTVHTDANKRVMENINEISKVVTSPVGKLSLIDIEKAEVMLLQLAKLIQTDKNSINTEEYKDLVTDYFDLLFKGDRSISQGEKSTWKLESLDQIEKHLQICQLLKDLSCTNEGLGGTNDIDMKYTSLQCDIFSLEQKNPEKYNRLKHEITTKVAKGSKQSFNISAIYQIDRKDEHQHAKFRSKIGNVSEYMFHGTSSANILGILRRGMKVPRATIIPDQNDPHWYYNGIRRDVGMLGAGIYFTDDFQSASKYAHLSTSSQKRYTFVSEVALGNVSETYAFNTKLTRPPKGYDSMHGVKTNPKANPPIESQFVDDEYVVYNAQQQTLRYLVEFNLLTDVPPPIDHIEPPHDLDQEADLIESIQSALSKLEIKNSEIAEKAMAKTESFISEKAPEKEVFNAGLYSSSGAKVPLKSTHIRARILDVIGQVYLFQQYTNDSESAIEAKYVFPLDEMSAVCGFEAFINGKHIIGHVEEKKKARKEYKKAIEQGHGAYLMEQELPDCWTVSVGNLPPKCTVFIKIIYVTELQMEGEEVLFQFPSSLGGTAEEKAKHQQFQNVLETTHIDRSALSSIPQTLQIGIEMPYDIDRVYSPSHPEEHLLVKYTDTMATIELDSSKYQSLGGKDFTLRVALSDAYHPRMWVEEQPDHHDNSSSAIGANANSYHKAAMVVFYPKFDFKPNVDNEFLILFDQSGSMNDGNAKNIAINLITHLLSEMPPNSYFNFIRFGSGRDRLFVQSENSSDPQIITRAKQWITEIELSPQSLGGTDLYTTLYEIFLTVNKKRAPRNIILISDGQIPTLPACLSLIQQHAQHHRVFGFGVGSEVSRYSISSLSRAGRGYAEFITSPSSSTNPTGTTDIEKVKRQYAKMLQPALSNVNCLWQSSSPIEQSPSQIVSIFNGQRLVIYGMLNQVMCMSTRLSCKAEDGELLETFVTTSELSITRGDFIHKLAARGVLRDFEEGILLPSSLSELNDDINGDDDEANNVVADAVSDQIVKKEKTKAMIELSCKYNVVCSLTSFLAIEERSLEEQQKLKSGDITRTPVHSITDLYRAQIVDKLEYIPWGTGVEIKLQQLKDKIDRENAKSALLLDLPFTSEKNKKPVLSSSDDHHGGDGDDDAMMLDFEDDNEEGEENIRGGEDDNKRMKSTEKMLDNLFSMIDNEFMMKKKTPAVSLSPKADAASSSPTTKGRLSTLKLFRNEAESSKRTFGRSSSSTSLFDDDNDDIFECCDEAEYYNEDDDEDGDGCYDNSDDDEADDVYVSSSSISSFAKMKQAEPKPSLRPLSSASASASASVSSSSKASESIKSFDLLPEVEEYGGIESEEDVAFGLFDDDYYSPPKSQPPPQPLKPVIPSKPLPQVEEEEEDESGDMGFGLFDGGDYSPPKSQPPLRPAIHSKPAPASIQTQFKLARLPPPQQQQQLLQLQQQQQPPPHTRHSTTRSPFMLSARRAPSSSTTVVNTTTTTSSSSSSYSPSSPSYSPTSPSYSPTSPSYSPTSPSSSSSSFSPFSLSSLPLSSESAMPRMAAPAPPPPSEPKKEKKMKKKKAGFSSFFGKLKDAKKSEKKSLSINAPTDFRHESHIGWDIPTGFDADYNNNNNNNNNNMLFDDDDSWGMSETKSSEGTYAPPPPPPALYASPPPPPPPQYRGGPPPPQGPPPPALGYGAPSSYMQLSSSPSSSSSSYAPQLADSSVAYNNYSLPTVHPSIPSYSPAPPPPMGGYAGYGYAGDSFGYVGGYAAGSMPPPPPPSAIPLMSMISPDSLMLDAYSAPPPVSAESGFSSRGRGRGGGGSGGRGGGGRESQSQSRRMRDAPTTRNLSMMMVEEDTRCVDPFVMPETNSLSSYMYSQFECEEKERSEIQKKRKEEEEECRREEERPRSERERERRNRRRNVEKEELNRRASSDRDRDRDRMEDLKGKLMERRMRIRDIACDLKPEIESSFPPAIPPPRYLEITVVEAANLPGMNNGSVNAFVRVLYGPSTIIQTDYAYKTRSPKWLQTFKLSGSYPAIILELYDHDTEGTDRMIGYVVCLISLDTLEIDKPVDHWLEVRSSANAPGGGQIHFRITAKYLTADFSSEEEIIEQQRLYTQLRKVESELNAANAYLSSSSSSSSYPPSSSAYPQSSSSSSSSSYSMRNDDYNNYILPQSNNVASYDLRGDADVYAPPVVRYDIQNQQSSSSSPSYQYSPSSYFDDNNSEVTINSLKQKHEQLKHQINNLRQQVQQPQQQQQQQQQLVLRSNVSMMPFYTEMCNLLIRLRNNMHEGTWSDLYNFEKELASAGLLQAGEITSKLTAVYYQTLPERSLIEKIVATTIAVYFLSLFVESRFAKSPNSSVDLEMIKQISSQAQVWLNEEEKKGLCNLLGLGFSFYSFIEKILSPRLSDLRMNTKVNYSAEEQEGIVSLKWNNVF